MSVRRLQKYFLAALMGAGCHLSAMAEPELSNRIHFQNILENKDIALGEVGAIYQDKEGFMWFGGASFLVKYDGYELAAIPKLVTNDQGQTSELPLKFATKIFEDSSGNLWIAARSGLYRYDPQLSGLIGIPDSKTDPLKLSTVHVHDAHQYSDNEIILATPGGIVSVDIASRTYTSYLPGFNNSKWVSDYWTYSIYKDNDKIIYAGTREGLEVIDWQNKQSRLIDVSPGEDNNVMADSVIDIEADERGILWLGTRQGLVRFDPKTEDMQRFSADPDDPKKLASGDIWDIYIDDNQTPWIATDGGGLAAYDKQNDRFFSYQSVTGRAGSISSNAVRTVFEDRNGDIWAGNYPGGINFFDRSSSAVETYTNEPGNLESLSSNSITGIVEDKDGNYWISTDGGGLNFFDSEAGTFTRYLHDPNDPSTPSSNAVLSIMQASDGRLWCGTWAGGVFIFDPVTKKATRLPFDASNPDVLRYDMDALNSQSAWDVREGEDGNMWIGTHFGGLALYNTNTKTFTHWTVEPGNTKSIATNLVWMTMVDSLGIHWLGTAQGIAFADPINDVFKHYLPDPNDPTSLSNSSVLSMHEDSQGRFWVGTDAGINLMNRESGTFKRLTKLDGLNDDTIRDIIEDEYGKLWLPTNNGVSVLDPDTNEIKNYTRAGGKLLGGFNTNSSLKSSDNEILLGGFEGLRIYKPAKMSANSVPPRVVLTNLQVMSEKISAGDESGILETALHRTKKIVLDHTKTVFMFEFAALNYRNPEKNEYAYKLEGFDDEWLYVGHGRQARYTNLDSGTYTFRVKASNNDGVWNEDGAAITVVQLPPPWQTWWAYTLYIIAALAAVAYFVRAQRLKAEIAAEQNRILEMKVNERTAALREKNNDIRAMLSNMPQGLFTIEKDGKVHHEYAQYLETIFETNEIARKDAIDLLFNKSTVTGDRLETIKSAVGAIIGEDEINYDFNAGHLMHEYHVDINGKLKQLELDWNPITEQETVTKLMVSVRDVTELKSMQREALEKRRQLDIIGQLVHVSSDKFLHFEQAARQGLMTCQSILDTDAEISQSLIDELFRTMHTIKGNARTLGFTMVSDAAHEAENLFHRKSNRSDLQLAVNDVLEVLEAYAHVFHVVLERDSSGHGDGVWVSHSMMDKLQSIAAREKVASLEQTLETLQAKPFENVIEDVLTSVSSLAKQLGKPAPHIHVNGDDALIRHPAFELFNSVFSHTVRNCLDHGIELPTERAAQGKKTVGNIFITTRMTNNALEVSIQDDGRGLDLAKLQEKAKQLKLPFNSEQPSDSEVANNIFHAGVTTKATVSDISGRGVGMDAVKNLLQAQQGNATIQLLPDKQTQKGFIPFRLILQFPDTVLVSIDDQNPMLSAS